MKRAVGITPVKQEIFAAMEDFLDLLEREITQYLGKLRSIAAQTVGDAAELLETTVH